MNNQNNYEGLQKLWTLADIVKHTSANNYCSDFENNFGRIKADEILLYDSDLRLSAAKIIILKLIKKRCGVNKYLTGMMASLTFAVAFGVPELIYTYSCLSITLVLIAIRWKAYHVQVNVLESAPVCLKIKWRNVDDASEFIREYNNSRELVN